MSHAWCKYLLICLVLLLLIVSLIDCKKRKRHRGLPRIYGKRRNTKKPKKSITKTICMQLDNTLRARHRSCFLRPDTGPCRADIIQWYFDVRQTKCYRFFWGGCQGNGNRFESKDECFGHCFINNSMPPVQIPHFCSLSFDYGSCFGHYNRWAWDTFSKTCKRRLYSGCGGNQNNFETRDECLANCLRPPNNTMHNLESYTTCVPFQIPEHQ